MASPTSRQDQAGDPSPGAVVEYEQSGTPHLALAIEQRSGKWRIVNESAKELQLPASRLFCYPAPPQSLPSTADERTKLLRSLLDNAEQEVEICELWETVVEENRTFALQELTEILYTQPSLANLIALRRALLNDTTYFKRRKDQFEPRSAEAVEQLKIKAEVESRKAEERDALVEELVRSIKGEPVELPSSVVLLEQFAALGVHARQSKKSHEVVREVAERSGRKLSGRPEDQAFDILLAAKHFSETENLSVYKYGRSRKFSPELLEEAQRVSEKIEAAAAQGDPQREDLTALHMFSIDSEDTSDIDDALSLEETERGFRIGVHIADVAAAIAHGSSLHNEALLRATSIYCPDFQIPMFPPALSAGALSLVQGRPRQAVSFFVEVNRSGEVLSRAVLRSLIKVAKRLSYNEVDELLCRENSSTSFDEKTDFALPELWALSVKLEERRCDNGAIAFHRREMTPVVDPAGNIRLEESMDDSPSRKLVGEMMILANETAALSARDAGVPLIFRSQEPPDIDIEAAAEEVPEGPAREYFLRSLLKRSVASTDPLPHAGLGLEAYTHSTSPIRRVIDLINQRQLMSSLESGTAFYDLDQMQLLKGQVEASLSEANAVQRDGARQWLLTYLERRNIRSIGATIVKTDGPKPLAELDEVFSLIPFTPSAKANKMRGGLQHRRGERINLKVQRLFPRRLYIALAEE